MSGSEVRLLYRDLDGQLQEATTDLFRGPPGEQGVPGPPGFVDRILHVQSEALQDWVIDYPHAVPPHVSVYLDGLLVDATVSVDEEAKQMLVHFGSPCSGRAVLG